MLITNSVAPGSFAFGPICLYMSLKVGMTLIIMMQMTPTATTKIAIG